MDVKIKEIFVSVQGEGPFVGVDQLFIRFCGCNLNCNYCDTDFGVNGALSYTPQDLAQKIQKEFDLNKIHSISLTGGEPLLYSEFIAEFVHYLPETKIYLETNATLTDELIKIKDKIDIISADIKLPSSSGCETFAMHDEFLKYCTGVYTFAKIVFDRSITTQEIKKCTDLGKKHNIELILQPKMSGTEISSSNIFCQQIFNKFLELYPNIRLIPQVHKFLDIR